ncbi:SusD/RagB family nutrient-binding outer membrane lipoprotein [Mariniphaga anaerophila]|nr:SusD/RagB family nutrient-binding outer membrane lipoprotein [Mariniphaga anaerophila]
MNTKNSWFLLILMLFFTTNCDDKFEEINTNPNSVTSIDNEYLFANSVLETFRGDGQKFLQYPFGSQYAHIYTGGNNALFVDRYFDYFESVEYKYVFEGFFYGSIRLVEEVLRVTQPGGEAENEVRFAMAQVVSMINYARLADSFGSIPYKQGGVGQTGVLYPEYDSVESIYKDMMDRLKEITALLNTADPTLGYPGADPLYNNDMKKWARFANSFRLRLATRARFADPDYTKKVITECLAHDLIEDNDQNAVNKNQDSDIEEFSNPVYSHYGYWKWNMSELLVNFLKSNNDPRLPLFVKPNSNGEFVGLPNGLSDEYLLNWNSDNISAPTDLLVGKAAPTYLMAAAEIWFLRAEAALFNLVPGDADELYKTGIRKSFEQWGVPPNQIVAYLTEAENATLKGSQEEMLEQISTQMWISFMSNPVEAWSNIRRTGYPRIQKRTAPEFSLGDTNGLLPTRLKYPTSEININNQNYLKAVAEQGADNISTPIWWDVQR